MDEEQLIERLDDILTKTANALHGDTPKNTLHSWHDLPERVERLRQERDEARREVCRGEARLRLQRHHAHKDSEEVVLKAKEISVERGWDCFKEDTND